MNKIKSCSTYYLPFLAAILSFTTIYYLNSNILAETPPEPSAYTPAEDWILKQVRDGKVADLKEQFPEEKDRKLKVSFLEKLLINSLKGVRVHRHGVRIKNAVINESLDLENAEIPHETWLVNCRFENDVNFSKSIFLKRP